MIKRLVLSVAAILLVAPLPAAFAIGPEVTAAVLGASDGGVVSGSVALTAQGKSDGGVTEVELFIAGASVSKNSTNGFRTSLSTAHNWATSGLRNGSYFVKATAKGAGGNAAQQISVIVDNPADAPTGVSASRSGDVVTVNWNANSEPDISGYEVQRDSGSGFSKVGSTQSTSLEDRPGSGTHVYRVVAVRASIVSDGKASAPSSSTPSITVPAASGGGGGGGGNGDGNSGGGTNGGGGGGKNGAGDHRFSVKGTNFATRGLPTSFSRFSVPALLGLPNLPKEEAFEWGSYQEALPYNLSNQPRGLLAKFGVAARSPDRLIPPDGLRWVALGLLLAVAALMLQLMSRRVKDPDSERVSGYLAEIKQSVIGRDVETI